MIFPIDIVGILKYIQLVESVFFYYLGIMEKFRWNNVMRRTHL